VLDFSFLMVNEEEDVLLSQKLQKCFTFLVWNMWIEET